MEEVQEYKPIVATPLKDGAVAPILDEESYNTLLRMLKSRDEADHKMAQLALNTCDIEKSIYWIWKLCREAGYWNMVNLRTKASRAFRDKSYLFHIWNKKSLSFAEFCGGKGWLTPEIYQRLESNIQETMENQFRNTFYDIDYRIKDKFKHLSVTTTSIKLTYE